MKLEEENAKLKRLMANLTLGKAKAMPQDVLRRKW
jgi:hypothetical protein